MNTCYQDRILRVLAYIHDNPAGDLSLDRLADVAAMSRFHWHRVFHGMTGETCAQAVRRIRAHRAACWLVQTDLPVTQIAGRCGYDNVQSFARLFRDRYGVSPTAFRGRGSLAQPETHQPGKDRTMFDVTLQETPKLRLMALPHRGPYITIGRAYEQLGMLASDPELARHLGGMVGLYHDDPNAVAEPDLRSHAAFVVPQGITLPKGTEDLTYPAGRLAVLLFKGPYAGLKAGYDYLFGEWLPQSGEEPRDAPAMERYLNTPQDTAQDDLRTEICLPLQ